MLAASQSLSDRDRTRCRSRSAQRNEFEGQRDALAGGGRRRILSVHATSSRLADASSRTVQTGASVTKQTGTFGTGLGQPEAAACPGTRQTE
jgi:hypothetical protein